MEGRQCSAITPQEPCPPLAHCLATTQKTRLVVAWHDAGGDRGRVGLGARLLEGVTDGRALLLKVVCKAAEGAGGRGGRVVGLIGATVGVAQLRAVGACGRARASHHTTLW